MDPYSGGVQSPSVFKAVLAIFGPVLLGFATIFQPKTNATDHWSTSPKITIQMEAASEESSDPPGPLDSGLPRQQLTAA